jgi:PilZ domain
MSSITPSFERDAASDRRRSPRCHTLMNWACLAWSEGGRMRISPAQLLDLSSVGACVLADEVPRDGRAAWLRLEEPAPTEWVKASVVRRTGSLKVGLDFEEHCPKGFFNAATQGQVE